MTSADMLARIRTMLQETGVNNGLYAFTVSGITTAPTVDNISTNNSQNFTVIQTTLTGTAPNIAGTIIAKGTGAPSTGNLTKIFGTGDVNVAFSAYSTLQSGFWSDTEIYAALTDGQREIINKWLSIYEAQMNVNPNAILPEVLEPLITINAALSVSGNTVALPAGFIFDLNAVIGTAPLRKRQVERQMPFDQANSFLKASSTDDMYYIAGSNLYTENTASGTLTLKYLAAPPDITSSQNPTLKPNVHNSIVQFAYVELLKKNEENQRNSIKEFQQFQAMSQ
jgi:hypothetical protein